MPWVGALVHLVEVEGGLQLGLAAGQEHDAWDGWGHAAAEELEGVVSDLGGAVAGLALSAWGDHGGLQQDTLEEHLRTHTDSQRNTDTREHSTSTYARTVGAK